MSLFCTETQIHKERKCCQGGSPTGEGDHPKPSVRESGRVEREPSLIE